jgi:hypothetical protein
MHGPDHPAGSIVHSAANTGGMRGRTGLAVLQALIRGVQSYLPADVSTVRVRLTGTQGFQLWAVPADLPEGVEYDFVEVRITPSGGHLETRGPLAPFGFGTFLPVFGATRTRMEVADALSLIQEAVERLSGPWPELNAVPKARSDGDDVLVWFEDSGGDHLTPDIRITAPEPPS